MIIFNPPFQKGDKVLCINDEQTYVENRGQLLKTDREYTILRMTWFLSIHNVWVGYVWVNEVPAPYIPSRFEKV